MSQSGKAKQRVWILGAGFPRSLGAPLLNDLLSPITELQIAARYPNMPTGAEGWVSHVVGLFGYGTRFEAGHSLAIDAQPQGRRHWRHAEHFLEYLDDIDDDGSAGNQVLEKIWKRAWADSQRGVSSSALTFPGAKKLANQARKVIAAACSAFIQDDFLKRERTQPYLAWAKQLDSNDTVLSFNYDRVLESLQWEKQQQENTHHYNFHIVNPSYNQHSRESDLEASSAQLPALLKLHGSVDWCLANDNPNIVTRDWDPAQLLNEQYEFAIATPGKMKVWMTNEFFSKLWKEAEESVERADEIFIIGCRLAEGDAKARDTILDAIKKNTRTCTVNLVLGTNTGSGDVRRLESLLEGVVKRDSIKTHPLWAEDFLSKWARGQAS